MLQAIKFKCGEMEGTSSVSNPSTLDDPHLLVDDFFFSAFYDAEEEIFPISDEKYAQELQLQEALFSSALSSASRVINQVDDDEIVSLSRTLKGKQKETSESSQISQMYCAICMDAKPVEEMFKNQTCSHSFCDECIGGHVAAKIQENISLVKCPDPKCRGILEPHQCRSIIPEEVFDRWENALCENLVLVSQKFYCPFKDCSAMLVNDDEEQVLTSSECPHCNRLFCAQCKVPWHAGIDCNGFRNLKKGEREDLIVVELAKTKNWKRCLKCKYYVEKIQGCSRISCRCGYEFCYGCGSPWAQSHYACGSR